MHVVRSLGQQLPAVIPNAAPNVAAGVGKSTTAVNLAYTLAQMGAKVHKMGADRPRLCWGECSAPARPISTAACREISTSSGHLFPSTACLARWASLTPTCTGPRCPP